MSTNVTVSGIFALCIDPANGGNDSINNLVTCHGELPNTLTAETTQGCKQMVFLASGGTKLMPTLGTNYPGIRVLIDGDVVVVDGESVEIADAPEWLVALASGEAAPQEEVPPSAAETTSPNTGSLLEKALALLEKGLHVFPLGGYGEAPPQFFIDDQQGDAAAASKAWP